MERRMRWKSHVRCGVGEKLEITSNTYLSLSSQYSGTRGEKDVSEAVIAARNENIALFNIYFAESSGDRKQYLPGFKKMYKNKGIISCEPKNIGHELLRVIKRELKR